MTIVLSTIVWKPTSLHLIEASSHGYIRSRFTGEISTGTVDTAGYYTVTLRVNKIRVKKYVHRLVCEAFHGRSNLLDAVVDHINGNKLDNSASNLRWLTRGQNVSLGIRGHKHGRASLSADQVCSVRKDYKTMIIADIARKYGVSNSCISHICHNRSHQNREII